MIKVGYHKKRFFLMGMIAFCAILFVVIVSILISSRTFDDRGRAVSALGMELNPNSGKIGQEGLDIGLIVHTGAEEIRGVKLTLKYSETIDYVSFAQGEIPNCVVSDLRQEGNKVNMFCAIDSDKPAYRGDEGIFATVKFRSVSNGDASIEVTNVTFVVNDNDIKLTDVKGNYVAESKIAMELEPSSGVISQEDFDIDLIINTHGEEAQGIDVLLAYSGDIEYINFSQGEIDGCEVVETQPEQTDQEDRNLISYFCFIDSRYPSYNDFDDVFITLKFKSKHQGSEDVYEGEGMIEILRVDFSVDDGGAEASFAGGKGEYETTYTRPPEPVQPKCGMRAKNYEHDAKGWQSETSFCSVGSAEPSNPVFPEEGKTTNWECLSDDLKISCSAKRNVTPPPPPPACGSRAQTFSHDVLNWPENSTFCRVGVASPEELLFPEIGNKVEWECINADKSIRCSALRNVEPRPQTEEPLPETSIFDNSKFLLGFTLVLISAILIAYRKKGSAENFSMRNKLCL